MKFSLNDIEREVKKRENRPEIDSDAINKQCAKVIAELTKRSILPPNKAISESLVKFMAETKLEVREKGLFLLGGTGTGKTVALKIVSAFRKYPVFYCDRLVSRYLANKKTFSEIFEYEKDIIIDDLGAEVTINDFGMKFELLTQIITDRHRLYTERGYLTLFSTNLNKDDFILRYGQRVYSRIKQMCEPVLCDGQDLRVINKDRIQRK